MRYDDCIDITFVFSMDCKKRDHKRNTKKKNIQIKGEQFFGLPRFYERITLLQSIYCSLCRSFNVLRENN